MYPKIIIFYLMDSFTFFANKVRSKQKFWCSETSWSNLSNEERQHCCKLIAVSILPPLSIYSSWKLCWPKIQMVFAMNWLPGILIVYMSWYSSYCWKKYFKRNTRKMLWVSVVTILCTNISSGLELWQSLEEY